MGGPWEKYAAKKDTPAGKPWEKYAKAPAPSANEVRPSSGVVAPAPGAGVPEPRHPYVAGEAQKDPSLIDELRGMLHDQGATVAGGLVGGALGTPAGPAGVVAGATLGGAAGKSLQKLSDYATGWKRPSEDTAAQNARDIGLAGLGQGAAEAGFAGLAALKPVAQTLIAGGARIGAGVPTHYGTAVVKDPSILWRAKSAEKVGEAYEAFQKTTGLKGLEETLVASGRVTAPVSELEANVIGVANKVAAQKPVTPQELYTASQSASRLKLMSKFRDPQAQMAAASKALGQGKQIVDGALEKIYPGYSKLRTEKFKSSAKGAFMHLLPQNQNMTPNALRGVSAAGALLAGHPGAMAAASPAAWGAGIAAGGAVSPLISALAKFGIRVGAAKATDNEKETQQP